MAETGEEIEDLQGKDLECKCSKSTKKNVRRWPIITAKATTARIRSKESEAVAESLRGIQAREWEKEVPDEVQAPFQPFAWP